MSRALNLAKAGAGLAGDSLGNVGVGVTPSAWDTAYKAVQVGARSMFFGIGSEANMANNAYYNSGYKYVANSAAGLYTIDANVHKWNSAASGTAGNAISFTTTMTLDGNGNLGLGTTSPSNYAGYTTLTLNNSSGGEIDFKVGNTLYADMYANTTGLFIRAQQNTPMMLWAGGAERMRIDSSGNVGIGGAASSGKFHVIGDWVSGNATVKAQTVTSIASGGTVGFGTFDSNGTRLGYLYSQTGFTAVGSTTSTPLILETAGAERARIDTSGRLLVGTTTSYTDYANIQVRGDNKGVAIQDSTDNSYRAIYNQSGTLYFWNGSNESSLSTSGAWTNASDGRLKTNVREIEYGLSTVLATQPRHYERVDIDGTYIGFVAQELQAVIPEVVSGNPEKQLGVDYGSLVAVAFKAIQEQQALISDQAATIEQMQTRLAALEGA
jgi:hypothetical protein